MATTTPWGPAQTADKVAPGIMFYTTAGHGGVHLSAGRQAKVPAYMQCEGGWYEEDCDWCIPAIVFADEWNKWSKHADCEQAKSTLRNWHPAMYEQYFNVVLKPGESSQKDRYEWYKAHKHEMIVVAACGDWHENCPKGYVLVTACIGGRDPVTYQYCGPLHEFIVPQEDYANRDNESFVVDVTKYEERVA